MPLELHVLSGARSGSRLNFDKSIIAIGRHPLSDLRFDPEGDRDVSSRHAEIAGVGGRWILRDSNSTNGTFVNGKRVAEHDLRSGDVITFGEHGPRVEVRFASARADSTPATVVDSSHRASGRAPAPAAAPLARDTRKGAPGPQNTTERVALAVKQQTKPLRLALAAAVVLLLVGGTAAFLMNRSQAAKVDALLARNDSLSHAIDSQRLALGDRVQWLDSAFSSEKNKAVELRRQAEMGGAAGEAAKAALATSLGRQQSMLRAAQINLVDINSSNGKAVALIFVETADGKSYSGTGFCVSSSGVIVTNRHLVQDEQGRPPKRIYVIFSDTKDGLAAKVVHVVPSGPDLAVLQLTEGSNHPVIRGLAADRSGIPVGAPLAIIGYPLGLDTPMDQKGEEITARATLGAGTLSKALSDVLQIDAYAGEGSSGSPVFDSNGQVIGVVFGGAAEANGRIVYAVPLEKLKEELRTAGIR